MVAVKWAALVAKKAVIGGFPTVRAGLSIENISMNREVCFHVRIGQSIKKLLTHSVLLGHVNPLSNSSLSH